MKFKTLIIALLCFGAGTFARAEGDPIRDLEKRVVEKTLPNGLKVLILERPSSPSVAFNMMYKAGGVDEPEGKTGIAHFFEHLMFKGTRIVGTMDYSREKPILEKIDVLNRALTAETDKGASADAEKVRNFRTEISSAEAEAQKFRVPSEFEQIYQREGAEGLNAFTGKDMTGFVVSLPKNKWELWPLMESDRMANPVMREFYKERDVILEERRMRYENSPQGKLWESLLSTAFTTHPYHNPTIGWSADVAHLTVQDAERFFRTNYSPNNAAVAVVGGVDPSEVSEKMAKYFSKVHSQALPAKKVTEEPEQSDERRLTVTFDAEPSLLMAFHKINPPHPDNYAVEMIGEILSRGRTSRFYRNIMEKRIAVSAWASNGNPGERYPNLIVFGGAPQKPRVNSDLEKAIWKELDRLKKEPVPEKELQKIRNQLEAEFIRQLSSDSGMAQQLAYCEAVMGDWRYLFKYLEGIRAVTPGDILRVANAVFQKKNATVVTLERAK